MQSSISSDYNSNQLTTIRAIQEFLAELSAEKKETIRREIESYLEFRKRTSDFHDRYFTGFCAERCFSYKPAECCGKEGIIVFFSDIFINLILHPELDLEPIINRVSRKSNEKCVYLGDRGCLWPIKPVVCEMYVCVSAKWEVLKKEEPQTEEWDQLLELEKQFTKPDQPVLFDDLESIFLEAGYESPLAYFHKSPGLLRLKLNSGLITKEQYYELSGRKKKRKDEAG